MPQKRKTRLRRGDVISAQGTIIQIVKFEKGTIIGRLLGSSEICQVNPIHVQVNLSQIGETEKRYRERQRTHWALEPGSPIEVCSSHEEQWFCGKVLTKFLLAENPDVVADLWFQLSFYDVKMQRIRYKQLKYDDHRLRIVGPLIDSKYWSFLGIGKDLCQYRGTGGKPGLRPGKVDIPSPAEPSDEKVGPNPTTNQSPRPFIAE